MKSLSSKTYQCGVTIQGLTTLSGTVYLTGITNTASWDHVIVGTTAQGQIYTRTYAQFMGDVATGISLSSYVTGSGTTNYLPKFTGGSALGNSQIFDNGTNVGIGTTTPAAKLQVKGAGATSSTTALLVENSTGRLLLQSDDGGFTRVGGPTARLYVGVESGGAAARLVVNGEGLFSNGGTGNAGGFYIDQGGTSSASRTIWYNGSGASKNLITGNGDNYITSGNVGIGITTPSALLHIAKNATYNNVSNTALRVANVTSPNKAIDFGYDNTVDVGYIQGIEFGVAAKNLSLQSDGGNVGIGTITPTTKLHVVGTVTATAIQLNTGSGDYYINGSSNTLRIGSLTTANKIQLELFHSINPVSLGISYNGGEALPYIESVHPSYDVNTHLLFKPGGTENWRIGSHGSNHIYGSAFAIKPASNSYDFYLANSSGTALFYSDTSTGNIGIGTTSPSSKLDVSVTPSAAWMHLINADETAFRLTTYNNGTNNGSNTYAFKHGLYYNSTENATVTFYRGDSSVGGFLTFTTDNGTERMRITNTGNVGIGTTSPTAKLQVVETNNSATTYPLIINNQNNQAADGWGAGIKFSTSNPATGGNEVNKWSSIEAFDVNNYGSNSGLSFTVSDGYTKSKAMVINRYGGVGIGTTSPGFKLEVNGGATGNNIARFTTGGVGGGTRGLTMYSDNSQVKLQVSDNAGGIGTWAFLNLNPDGGYVGIGTTSPSTTLTVNGIITATGGNSTQWNTAYGWGNHASASYVPQARTLTINGTSYDLSANRTWTISAATPGGSDTQFQYNSSGSLAGASALTYNSTTNRVGINQASPGYDLDVNGQVRVQDKLRVGTVNSGNGVVHMSSTATINASATTIVWAQNVSVGMCAFIEYYILNSNSLTDQRAGTIIVTWNQSGTPTITHTETTTPDIGSTIAVNFTSSLVGSDARINAVNSSANPYTMVMSYKYF